MPRCKRRTLGLAMVLLLGVGIGPSAAHHQGGHDQNPDPPPPLGPTDILHFEAGSLIIPMDACHQRPTFIARQELDRIIAPLTVETAACTRANGADDGLIPAYSLVFRLIRAGIPVSWAIRSAKTSWHDVDFSVVLAGGAPVAHVTPGGVVDETRYQTVTAIRYRGAPFVVAASHAAEALTLMHQAAATHSVFRQTDVHIARGSFDAPIYRTVDTLPRLAVVDASDPATALVQQKTNFLASSIDDAVMTDLEGSLFDWVTLPEVLADRLSAGGYDLVWVPPFDLPSTPTARQLDFMNKLAAFTDGGGSILLQDGAVGAAEGHGAMSSGSYVAAQPTTTGFQTIGGGIIPNGLNGVWDNGNANEETAGQDYSDPASQYGGIFWTGIGGSKTDWRPRYDRSYQPGVRRMIFSRSTDASKNDWDFATWRRKDNDAQKGVIYYLGGYNWRRVTAAGFRVLMNTMLATQGTGGDTIVELARSAPIVAIVDGTEVQYQGTYEAELPPEPSTTYAGAAQDETFRFPGTLGHMRGLDVSLLTEGATSFADAASVPGLVLFDAANQLPPIQYTGDGCPFPADGSCRRIFTDTGDAAAPTRTLVVQGNRAALHAQLGAQLSGAEADTVIARIHAGHRDGAAWVPRLGGVDRSTVAVIEPSPLIPNGRPTMLYFGATDGMLHAVCAEAGGGCPAAGVELWAFLPSTELGKVITNTARIDGSPKVADVFGEFTGGRGLRTVLTFQTGNRDPSATYALDITDPTEPRLLWKQATPGPGVGLAMGWAKTGAVVTPMTFIQTAAQPGAAAGMEVRAVRTVSGELEWEQTVDVYAYPAPRTEGHPEVPATGMPGGVSLVPSLSGATVEHLLVPSLYGQVFKLDATTGENAYGDDPLFDFNEDFHPIGASVALYRSLDDQLRALIVSGGFADPFAPSGTEWAPDDVHQYAVGFPVSPELEGETAPISREAVRTSGGQLGIHIDFGLGQRAFSPAVVAGGEVFITTDSENVNSADYGSVGDSGRLWRASLEGGPGTPTVITIPSGAASVDVSIATGAVLTGGGGGVQRTNPIGFDATGASTEVIPDRSSSRRLWLRLR
jgi:hypothetical protein